MNHGHHSPRSWRSLGVAIAVAAFSLPILSSPVAANVIKRTDGNDIGGPLDLAAVGLSHSGKRHVVTISTIAAFTNAQIDGNVGWFEVGFDTNDDRKADRVLLVYYAAGKLHGVIVTASGSVVTKVPVSRVTPRSVRATFSPNSITPGGAYSFAVFSVWRSTPCTKKDPCIDAIPNRYPLLLHDYMAPTIQWVSVPLVSTDASANLTILTKFAVFENSYGSGLKSWTVQRRVYGGSDWVSVAKGTSHDPTLSVPGAEGTTYNLRVLAVDKQGNRAVSSLKTSTIPYDDANARFGYTLEASVAGVTGAFRGTTTTLPSTGTATTTVTSGWRQLCVLGGPTTTGFAAGASLYIDGTYTGTLVEFSGTAPRSKLACIDAMSGPHQVVITASDDGFVFDGLVVRP
jgi:hypothetical protein